MVGYRKIEGFEGMESSFVKTRLKWIALLCPILSLTYAQTTPNYAKNSLSGTSIGLNLAYNYSDIKHHFYRCDHTVFPDPWTGLWRKIDADELFKQKYHSIDPAISVGYSFLRNNWYLGMVGEVSFGKSRKRSEPINDYFYSVFSTSEFSQGIKVVGGYYFNDLNALVYGIAGLKWQNIETQVNYHGKKVDFLGYREKLTCPLFVIGTGIERLVCEKLSIFAEYEYTWRNSTNTPQTSRILIYKFKMKEHFKEHSFRLGVKYHI